MAEGVLVLVVMAGAAFLLYQFLLTPLWNRDRTVQTMREELERKRDRVREVLASRPKLEEWRALSLPADPDMARREYEKYLSGLLRESGFAAGSFSVVPKPTDSKTSPTLPGKGPIYSRLTFTVLAHGNLKSLVQTLQKFYTTGLLHQVKNLSIQRPLTTGGDQQSDGLDINMTIEGLSITGAGNRPYLLPNVQPRVLVVDAVAALCSGPTGLALASWAGTPMGPLGPGVLAQPVRQYNAIVAKNIFLGDLSPERRGEDVAVTRFVHLTDVTRTDRRWEAFLYDRTSNRKTRLRAEPGFDSFKITTGDGETVVRGKVLQIDTRDVVFTADNKHYKLHVGQSLEEAMRRPISDAELKALGLAAAPKSNGGS
jgi:hypothetical protein